MGRFAAADETREILIADDEEAICFCLARYLKSCGFAVLVAADGRAAIDLYTRRGRAIRGAFLDVRLPGLDGIEVLARLRAIDPTLPCCLMTAYRTDPAIRVQLATAPAPILDKPFDLADFQTVLDSLLDRVATAG